MRVVLGACKSGSDLMGLIAEALADDGCDVALVDADDFVSLAQRMSELLLDDPESLGLAIDSFGVGTYMAASKVKGMVAACISDERSAYMTREHNDCRLLCIGSKVVGPAIATKIAREFIGADYAGGRHQVRVDMLAKMA